MDRSPDNRLWLNSKRTIGPSASRLQIFPQSLLWLIAFLSACAAEPIANQPVQDHASTPILRNSDLAAGPQAEPVERSAWPPSGLVPASAAPPQVVPQVMSLPMVGGDVRPANWLVDSEDAGSFPAVLAEALPLLPTPPAQVEVPLNQPPSGEDSIQVQGQLITLAVRDAPLHSVLSLIADQQGLSVVSASDLTVPVSVTLQPMRLEEALDALTAISGCSWNRVDNVIFVTALNNDTPQNFAAQGRVLRVFNLNYLAATDAEAVVTGLLSPVGKVFIRQINEKEKRKAVEQLVIEDLPAYADRIESYLAQADQPPQQVVVEVRMLQVKLEADTRHGIDFDALARIAGGNVRLSTQAFATDIGQAAMVTVNNTDFNSLLDCLSTTNDTKTLAAPKLRMINGQESKIQIGRRLGYFVTTTTQTSTLQDVQFLEVGVVLTVTPQISSDGQIVLNVRPKVSNGDINPNTTLPEEETTEVETSIMVPDGHGVIIGGLIQEIDNERQSKIPLLGDIWLVGRLFQRRTVERERSEVIVALLPRIVPLEACPPPDEAFELQRAGAPLLTPRLESAPRPEPELLDATCNPIWPPRKRHD